MAVRLGVVGVEHEVLILAAVMHQDFEVVDVLGVEIERRRDVEIHLRRSGGLDRRNHLVRIDRRRPVLRPQQDENVPCGASVSRSALAALSW